jgi:3-oxoacyl-[acyl-carrier protein] reductase
MPNFLIIAASSGIGQATATLLRAAGHQVFTTARTDEKITPDALLEATDFAATEAVLRQAQEKMGGLDGVVNCAGSLLLKPAHLTTSEQYQATIASSLTAAFATVRAAGAVMTNGGSVVLMGSAAAHTGLPNHEAIAAAKAGVVGLMRAAAASYAPNNLRFNVVSPGLTETPLTAAISGNPAARKVSEAMHPLGRLGSADDVARAIVFLLDPANSWITGQVLGVDGGLATLRPKIKAGA